MDADLMLKWREVECAQKGLAKPICQLAMSTFSVPLNDGITCASEAMYNCWIQAGTMQIMFVSTAKMIDYVHSQEMCQQRGGFLVEPKTKAEIEELKSLLKNRPQQVAAHWWIGT